MFNDPDSFGIDSVSSFSPVSAAMVAAITRPSSVDPAAMAQLRGMPVGDASLKNMPTAEISTSGDIARNGGSANDQLETITQQTSAFMKSKQYTDSVRQVESSAKLLGVDVKDLIYALFNPGKGNPAAVTLQAHQLNMALTGVATCTGAAVKGCNKLANAAQ